MFVLLDVAQQEVSGQFHRRQGYQFNQFYASVTFASIIKAAQQLSNSIKIVLLNI